MQQLTEQEKKRIQRYCTYPKIAATALVMSFVACLLMLPLQMINDIAFHQKEFQPAGIYTAIALTVIELVIFCYCALAPRFGMQGRQWKELQSRLAVAQANKDRSAEVAGVLATQAAGRLLKNSDNDVARNLGGAAEVAGAVGAVATAANVLVETSSNAEAMANAYGVTIPSVKKQVIALAVVPAIVLLGGYIPQFVQGNNELQVRKAAAAEQLAGSVRLLVIPTASARFARRRSRKPRAGLLGRATSSLRIRLSGERGLYLISRGEITQLARSAELPDLTGRLAHAMSAVSASEGPLVYATLETGDARALRALEKPLDTNEFEARHLGTVSACPSVEKIIGSGAVGVAFAPSQAYWRASAPEQLK